MRSLRTLLVSFLGLNAFSLAHAKGDTVFKPVLVIGQTYFSGNSTKSLAGASETFLALTGESSGSRLRLTASADFGFSSGTANIGTDTPTYSMFNVGLAPGVAFYPFKESSFQPYISVKGIFGLHRFAMTSPPTSLPKSSQGFNYGYEVAIGTDLRFKKGDKGTAVRVYGAVRAVKGTVAEQASFDLGGFRFGLGLIF